MRQKGSEAPNIKVINNALLEWKDEPAKINKNYTINVDGSDKRSLEFLKETNKTQFPTFKGLKIVDMNSIDNDTLNTFFGESVKENIQYLYLENGGEDIKPVTDSLCKTLKQVQQEIFLEKMRFDQDSLEQVVSASSGVRFLIFKNCIFNIDNTFKAKQSEYSFENLTLFNCFNKNTDAFEHFAKGMKGTSLKKLKFELHLSKSDFPKAGKPPRKSEGKRNVDYIEWRLDDEIYQEFKDIFHNICLYYRKIDLGDWIYEGQVVDGEIAGHGIYTHKKTKAKRIHF